MLLTIEKLIYGGDGLARLPADLPTAGLRANKTGERGKAVFVPFVLAGEKIEACLTEQKPGFARAAVDAVIEPSPHRIQPSCPYFGRCGGCHYQHIRYEQQLEIKKEILRETLRRTAKLELPFDIEEMCIRDSRRTLLVTTQSSMIVGEPRIADAGEVSSPLTPEELRKIHASAIRGSPTIIEDWVVTRRVLLLRA